MGSRSVRTIDESLTVYVPGEPAMKGSKTLGYSKKTGRTFCREPRALYRWEQLVKSCALDQAPLLHLLPGPVTVACLFFLRRPKYHYGTGKNAHRLRPSAPEYPTSKHDNDKLQRAIMDGLTDVLWSDDGVVVDVYSGKRWAVVRPGVGV